MVKEMIDKLNEALKASAGDERFGWEAKYENVRRMGMPKLEAEESSDEG